MNGSTEQEAMQDAVRSIQYHEAQSLLLLLAILILGYLFFRLFRAAPPPHDRAGRIDES